MPKINDIVSIIIVNYNGKTFLKDCLDSVFSQNYPYFEVIFVDNGSSDESVKYVKSNYKKVRVLINSSNNYCMANNIGIKNAKGRYVVLLNNDTRVEKEWLKELVRVIKEKRCAAVQSKVLLMDGKINSAGIVELPNFYIDNLGFLENDEGQYDYDREIFAPYNASAIYDRDKIISAGLFDEDFEHYVDEMDMSYRLKINGEKIYFAYKSIVYHKYKGTFSTMEDRFTRYTERNRLYYVAKYFPLNLTEAFTSSHLFYKDILNNHPLLISLLPEVINKLMKHQPSEIYIPVIMGLIKNLEDTLKLDNADFNKRLNILERQIEKEREVFEKEIETSHMIRDKERDVFEKERESLKMSYEKEREVFEREIEHLQMARDKEREVFEKESSKLKDEINTLVQAREEERATYERGLAELTHMREKERSIYEMEIEDLKKRHEKEKQEDLKEISSLKRRIFDFYSSKGYKYLLRPLDKLYKKLR